MQFGHRSNVLETPDIQSKLRQEIFALGSDLSYDQLSSSLSYMDVVVVHETLPVHPPATESIRVVC